MIDPERPGRKESSLDCEFCGEEVAEGALACPRCGSPAPKSREAREGDGTETTQAPPDIPLARAEEDYVTLAEEGAPDAGAGEQQFDPEGPGFDAGEPANETVAPGEKVAAEVVTLDFQATGGYQGQAGPSVGGAGVQTADDPFGLTISESPPDLAPVEGRRMFDFRSASNIVIMVVSAIFVVAVVTTGLYYGLGRRGSSSGGPEVVARQFFDLAVAGDSAGLAAVSVQGSMLGDQVSQALFPYRQQGNVSLKGFAGKTTATGADSAKVDITRLDVSVMTDNGTVDHDLLDHNASMPLPVTVELVKQNGKWRVKT